MYILKGKKRNELRWLLVVGMAMIVIVVLFDHFRLITAEEAFLLMDTYFILSLLAIFINLRTSNEVGLLAPDGLLAKSATRFTLFAYMVYGSVALYPLAEKNFRSEFIGEIGFFIILLVIGFPDVLLFLRTKAPSGKPIYQRANLIGFWILALFVIASICAAIIAGR